MDNEDAFVQACIAAPTDEVCRLMYADWLEERGDERGAYLRLEHELCLRFESGEGVSKEDAKRLVKKASQFGVWVNHAGLKCDLRLHHYPRNGKLITIILVREATGLGLREAKELVESLPALDDHFTSGCALLIGLDRLRRFRQAG